MTKRLVMFSALFLWMVGAAWAGGAPAAQEPALPPELTAPASQPDCQATAALPLDLSQNLSPATPQKARPKAGGTWTYGGCQCYTNCSSAGCICSDDWCCSACCADAKRNLC